MDTNVKPISSAPATDAGSARSGRVDEGVDDSDALGQLLAPLDPRVFVEEYWGRRPIHVKGTPKKFQHLFSLERFYKAVECAAKRTSSGSFRLGAVIRDFEGAFTRTEPISPSEISSTLADGSSVCVNDITLGDEQLSSLCRAVKRQMNFVGSVRFNSYLSPDMSGADTHFDTSVSTTLQIEGRKRWRFGKRPALPWPLSNAQVQRDGTGVWSLPWVGHQPWEQLDPVRFEDFDEVVLEPGDFLCLPAGTWHNAKAIDHSLALNMAFTPASPFAILIRILESLLEEREAWRSGPPPVHSNNTESDGLPVRVQQYFEDRLSEVREQLAALDFNDEAVRSIWRKIIK